MRHAAGEIQQKMIKDGSFLKGLRCQLGVGAGLFGGGICLLVMGVFIAALCFLGKMVAGGIFLFVILAIPGLILLVVGLILKNTQKKGWMQYYQKQTGFTQAELEQIDQELMAPDMVTIGNRQAGQGKKAPFYYCYVTEHYFVMPMVAAMVSIMRIEDIVAITYSNQIPANYQPDPKRTLYVKSGLLYLTAWDKGTRINELLDEQSGQELVEEILKRNPLVITAHRFMYQDRAYDLLKNEKEIIALQLEHRKKVNQAATN